MAHRFPLLLRAIDPRHSVGPAIGLVALVWLLTLATLDPRGMWISDNENKLLQTKAILAGGLSDSALRWAGREIDPQLSMNPIPAPFSYVKDGRIWSQYPPAFAALSALPLGWFSFPGLYCWPWFGAVLALAAVAQLARQAGLRTSGAQLAVLLTGLCTPLWFYAVVFWEHSLALGLALWALHFALRDAQAASRASAALAGALAAAAVWLRDDMLLWGALLVCLVWAAARSSRSSRWRAALVTAGALAAGLALLMVFQSLTIDSALGYHLQSNLADLGAHLRSRPTVFYRLLLAAGPGTLGSLAITAPFVVLGLAWPRIAAARQVKALGALAWIAALAGLAALGGFFTAQNGPIVHLLSANSLFPAAPFLLLAGLRPAAATEDRHTDGVLRRLRHMALAYAALYILLAPPAASQGIHWGNRFLLLLYPLLTVLAVCAVQRALPAPRLARRNWVAIGGVGLVVLVSLAAQLYSIDLLRQKTDFSRRLNQEVAQRLEPVVVTDTWWVPLGLFEVLDQKPLFLVRGPEQFARLKAALQQRGVTRLAFVGSASGRALRPGELLVEDGGLGFFSVAIERRAVSP